MALSLFSDYRWTREKDHERYRDSILAPVAPEWATGEVLLSGAYRKLLLGVSESSVDRRQLQSLSNDLPRPALWADLFAHAAGLQSPPSKKEMLGLAQLMPYVPEIARYAGVLGQPRHRWDPGNLLLTALAAGCHPSVFDDHVRRLATALDVDGSDDIFARFVEYSLRQLPGTARTTSTTVPRNPAWRPTVSDLLTPAERFTRDLDSVIELKPTVTRRQWTALVEALLRIGLAAHILWICRLNARTWELVQRAIDHNEVPILQDVEDQCWLSHHSEPLLALGHNATPLIRQSIQAFVQARIGLSLTLHALDDAGLPWNEQIGAGTHPSDSIHRLLNHICTNSDAVRSVIAQQFSGQGLWEVAGAVADANQALARGDDGFASNVNEFIRYSLSQLQPRDPELQSYDQSCMFRKRTSALNSPWLVQPGPTTLVLLVSTCCRSTGGVPSNLDDLKSHLSDYGVHASAGELQAGTTARDLELLGLVIDSPDAAGGRLLVDPFGY
jgi:hypothetical protein